MLSHLTLFGASFLLIWVGAGIVVSVVSKISHRLNLSSFAVSFFVLGFLTSVPEMTVGINAVLDGKPEIFVGNLVGGVMMIFLLIVPLFAILAGGVKLNHQLKHGNLLLTILVVAFPALLILDRRVGFFDATLLIVLYLSLFYSLERKKGILESIEEKVLFQQTSLGGDLAKVVLGVGLTFLASRIIVDQTVYLADSFGFSPFIVSFLVTTLGTNAPELSLAFRAVSLGEKEVAFGDYLGSAAFNSFLLGALTFVNGSPVSLTNHYSLGLLVFLAALLLFYVFAKSQSFLSRPEGLILLTLYFGGMGVEILNQLGS